ncbi:hypothetical protein [Haloarchaeobius sp. FL176]|uniref:hypothetical protein n=1 Tax=Haloarchaeobius sp. FL176 TaxID=2967129 RepID=UPI0021485BA2|nr:hypothetical protein [Haloarchaeobius sp. FL176]
MSDPKDELGQRFDDRRPDGNDKEGDMSQSDNTRNSSVSDDSSSSDNPNNTSDVSDTSDKPGPDPNPNSTRNRRQVPMYLPDEKADNLNSLYEQLDGRSKVAGEGGIEKHADFMETLVDFAIEHEDELAARLGIKKE